MLDLLVLKPTSNPSVLHCHMRAVFPGFLSRPVFWWVWIVGGLGREQEKEDKRNAGLVPHVYAYHIFSVSALTGGAHYVVPGVLIDP